MKSFARLPRQYATFEGHRVAYVDIGNGPTLLLLHGLGGTADFWQPVAELLQPNFRLIIPDLLGFGFSDKPRLTYSLARHMGAILAVLRAAQATSLHTLIGHSAGCVIAVALLASGQVQTTQVVLAAAPFPSPRYPVRQELVTRAFFNTLLDKPRIARFDDAIWRTLWPVLRWIGMWRIPDYLHGGLAGFMEYSADSYYGTVNEVLLRTDIEPLLPALQSIPILLIYGTTDETVPLSHGHRLQTLLPNATLIQPLGGHYAVIHEALPMFQAWLTSG